MLYFVKEYCTSKANNALILLSYMFLPVHAKKKTHGSVIIKFTNAFSAIILVQILYNNLSGR